MGNIANIKEKNQNLDYSMEKLLPLPLLDVKLEYVAKINADINIFICGKYEISHLYQLFIEYPNEKEMQKEKILNKKKKYKKNKDGISYNKTKNKYGNSYWKFYELSPIKSTKECESLKDLILKKIKKNLNLKFEEKKKAEKKKIQNANVIIYSCGENDDNDFEILNQLNKGIKKDSHPFIIFLSNKRTRDTYNDYIIKNELKNKKFFFDILNIYIISYGKENEILNVLWNIYNYYYQITPIDINSNDYVSDNCINIYLLGKPGTGKSSFINEVFQEKKSLENFGENQTDKINEFSYISKLNSLNNKIGRINIFDTPGFSTNGQELKTIEKNISKIFSEYISNKALIHCFLYFFNGSGTRTLDDNEIRFIELIHNYQTIHFSSSKIFFIINFTNKTKESDINSYKNFIHLTLKQNFRKLDDLWNKENIIEINLKRDVENNRELKFGIDEIFFKMYNYFKVHKININKIKNINNNGNMNSKEILNKQIEILNESMFFQFYKRFEDFQDVYVSACEQKIHLSKLETQRIGLFIFRSDITRCEEIRKNMFEFINDHFKVIFNCDIPFDRNDYMIGEDEGSQYYFVRKWFRMKENCPLITEQKGNNYLERNKIRAKEIHNHNIDFCIHLADLYNNSVDLLLTIINQKKLEIIKQEENIKFYKDLINAEQQSRYEYKTLCNNKNNIINNNFDLCDNQTNIINDNYNSLNFSENIFSNFNDNENIKIIKNYKENNEFIIELNIDIDHPSIDSNAILVGDYYVFKIIINEKEITFKKSILEIQLDNEDYKSIDKGNEKNKYIIKYELKKEKKLKKPKQF